MSATKRFLASAAIPLAVAGVIFGAMSAASIIGAHSSAGNRAIRVSADATQGSATSSDSLQGVAPWAQGLTPDQLLDRSLSQPGVHGVVRGVVGSPSTEVLPNPDRSQGNLLTTEFPFTIQALLGPEPSPYHAGETVTLRIPGGQIGNRGMSVEDAPQVKAGESVYVYVTDKPPFFAQQWGSNTSTMLVAISDDDVFVIRNGFVYGQGAFARLAEPVSTFQRHFAP